MFWKGAIMYESPIRRLMKALSSRWFFAGTMTVLILSIILGGVFRQEIFIFDTLWFRLVLGFLALGSLALTMFGGDGVRLNLGSFIAHNAIFLILLGGFLTVTGIEKGEMTLVLDGNPRSNFRLENGELQDLGFEVSLGGMIVDYYKGEHGKDAYKKDITKKKIKTYEGALELLGTDPDNSGLIKVEMIELNHPVYFGKYKLCIKDYKKHTTDYMVLDVRNEAGKTTAYIGMYLLMFGVVYAFYIDPLIKRRKK